MYSSLVFSTSYFGSNLCFRIHAVESDSNVYTKNVHKKIQYTTVCQSTETCEDLSRNECHCASISYSYVSYSFTLSKLESYKLTFMFINWIQGPSILSRSWKIWSRSIYRTKSKGTAQGAVPTIWRGRSKVPRFKICSFANESSCCWHNLWYENYCVTKS